MKLVYTKFARLNAIAFTAKRMILASIKNKISSSDLWHLNMKTNIQILTLKCVGYSDWNTMVISENPSDS